MTLKMFLNDVVKRSFNFYLKDYFENKLKLKTTVVYEGLNKVSIRFHNFDDNFIAKVSLYFYYKSEKVSSIDSYISVVYYDYEYLDLVLNKEHDYFGTSMLGKSIPVPLYENTEEVNTVMDIMVSDFSLFFISFVQKFEDYRDYIRQLRLVKADDTPIVFDVFSNFIVNNIFCNELKKYFLDRFNVSVSISERPYSVLEIRFINRDDDRSILSFLLLFCGQKYNERIAFDYEEVCSVFLKVFHVGEKFLTVSSITKDKLLDDFKYSVVNIKPDKFHSVNSLMVNSRYFFDFFLDVSGLKEDYEDYSEKEFIRLRGTEVF